MIPLATFLKFLHIALGYGSRSERIERMVHSEDPGVSMMAYSLVSRGLIDRTAGTIVVPK